MATLFNTKIKDTYQSLLKLEDNTILTTTSKNITDGLGNASPLYMSTTQVRIGSTSASALYWDNVNNRLGIGTSTPTQSIETPGAIKFASANSDSTVTLKAFDAATGNIDFTNEFIVSRQGTNLIKMFFNNRIAIGGAGSSAKLTVRGDGSTSATTSFLVQNSLGTNALQVTDDGNTFFYTASGATVRIGDSTTSIFRIINTYERINIQPISIGGSITLNAGTEAGASYTLNDNGHAFAYPFNRTTANTFTINRQFYGNVVSGTKTMLNITTSNITGLSNATTLRGIYFAPTITDWGSVVAFESTAGDVIINGGKVGIGTSSPTELLTVGSSGKIGLLSPAFGQTTTIDVNGYQGLNILTGPNSTQGIIINGYGSGPNSLSATNSTSNTIRNYVITYRGGSGKGVLIDPISTSVGESTASLQVKGSGSTSATTSLLVQNSAAQQLMSVLDDGSCTIGINGSTTNSLTIVGNSGIQAIIGNNNFQSPANIFRYGGGTITFFGNNNDGTAFSFGFNNNQASTTTTSAMIGLGGNYQSQQSFQFASLRINPTYDFHVNTTTNAIARGIYYNPTITNLQVAQHRAIETVTGNVILGSTSGNLLLGTTTDNGAKLRIESGDLSLTGYEPKFNINGTSRGRSYIKTDLAIDGTGVFGGIGMNTDIWLTPGSGSGGYAGNIPATMHFKVNGANPLTSATSHWLAGDNGKSVGYEFLTTHYRNSVPAAWYGPEISGGIVGLQQFNIGYEPKQYAGAGFTFVGVGLSGAVSDPFTRVTEFNPIRIDYSLASGGSNITARGVYYKPTFTSVYPLLVNNAFESTSGSLVMSGESSRVSSTIGRGAYLNQTLRPANMTGDTLIGLDINPTFTSSATQISTFTYIGGTGYTYQTIWENIPLTGGTGTGATVNITVGAGNLVTAVTVANRGTGYTVNDVLTLPAQNMTQATGFSVTVTAVGASTYNSYGLLVRNGRTSNNTSTPPTGYNGSHTLSSAGLYWKNLSNENDRYIAIFENTAAYGNGILLKTHSMSHSNFEIVDENANKFFFIGDGFMSSSIGAFSANTTTFNIGGTYSGEGLGRLSIGGVGTVKGLSTSLYSNYGGEKAITFRNNGSGELAAISSTLDDLNFYTKGATGNFSSSDIRMRIASTTGNVLINTTTDSGYKLDVNGTARVSNLRSGSFYAASPLDVGIAGTGFMATFQYGAVAGGGSLFFVRAGAAAGGITSSRYENYDLVLGAGNYGSTLGIAIRPAQIGGVKIGGDNTTVTHVDSAILNVESTTKGVLFPRMTTAQKLAITSPVGGLQVFDTTLNQMSYYNGSAWINF